MFAFSWPLNIKTHFQNQRVNDKKQFGVTATRICRNREVDSHILGWCKSNIGFALLNFAI